MIINSLLDNDLYKLSMMQAVLHQFPSAQVEYKFACRTKDVDLRPCLEDIKVAVLALERLSFLDKELAFLRKLRFMKPDFINFLQYFRFNPDAFVSLSADADPDQNGGISIRIKGPWLQTILFEIPILAIVNQVYFEQLRREPHVSYQTWQNEGLKRLQSKLDMLKYHPDFCFADFGTRRRFNGEWQRTVVRLAAESNKHFVGTSNVEMAMQNDVTPIGTMAHEWLQAGQALTHPANSQKFMLDAWVQEYRGDLGIALTDVVGIDAFLRDFDLFFAKLYDGVRHDSGDPLEFTDKMIDHYATLGIEPWTKTLVFSDGLDFPKAIKILKHVNSRAKVSFGIGTNLTNDVGFDPINIVIKMVSCNGQPVAKLSDSPGKNMCEDPEYVTYLKKTFKV